MRNGGVVAPQREILARAVTQWVEMAPHGYQNYCCGGGGGQLSMTRFSRRRLEAGRIKPEPVELDLDRWTRDLVARFPNGQERLRLAGSVLGPARLDERLIRHAFGNLLDNALKYSPADQPVQVELSRDGQDVLFVVADRGPGIPQEDVPKLMEGFHRGANVLHIPGTGLGLVVVKRCIELCGGTVTIGNRPGGGTRAEIRLPAFEGSGT